MGIFLARLQSFGVSALVALALDPQQDLHVEQAPADCLMTHTLERKQSYGVAILGDIDERFERLEAAVQHILDCQLDEPRLLFSTKYYKYSIQAFGMLRSEAVNMRGACSHCCKT